MKRLLLLLGLGAMMVMCSQNTLKAEIRLELISQLESSNNPKAFNKKTQAYGIFQITPVCLKHYNQLHPAAQLKTDQLFSAKQNKKVARWYFKWLSKQLREEKRILVAWNWGLKHARHWDGNIRTLPNETQKFLCKYILLKSH